MLVFAASRLFVVVVGVLAMLAFGAENGEADMIPALHEPFGRVGDLLAAAASRWDSGHYERIAADGYTEDPLRAAFFPLYPLLCTPRARFRARSSPRAPAQRWSRARSSRALLS